MDDDSFAYKQISDHPLTFISWYNKVKQSVSVINDK